MKGEGLAIAPEEQLAQQQIRAFAALYGEDTLRLAMYGAFAMTLTPKLLYCLRENSDKFTDLAAVPWYGPADVLLSALCQRVGNDLYEMEGPLRIALLERLRQEQGAGRIEQLSDFMMHYIAENLEGAGERSELVGGEPEWTAVACLQPGKLVERIKQDLAARWEKRQDGDHFYWSAMIESYGAMLPGEPLLMKLAREVAEGQLLGDLRAPDLSVWAADYGVKNLQWQSVVVGRLEPDQGITDARNPNVLQPFRFAVAKVNANGQEILPRVQKSADYFVEVLGDGKDPQAPLLELVAIPGGDFMMGSPVGEGYDRERPQHRVVVPPFFMGKYPVTQAQWRAVAAMKDLKDSLDLELSPSTFSGDDLPVENVSWREAQEFCRRVTKLARRQVGKTAWVCRLPSEAAWEYACRARTTTPFHFGPTISAQLANYNGNNTYGKGQKGPDRNRTTPVGSFGVANDFGLYDMHGNIWEWCEDNWHDNYKGAPSDGSDWVDSGSSSKILRGGSWIVNPKYCRSAYRYRFNIADLYDVWGFRVMYAPARTP